MDKHILFKSTGTYDSHETYECLARHVKTVDKKLWRIRPESVRLAEG
jgi:hypothetical protein